MNGIPVMPIIAELWTIARETWLAPSSFLDGEVGYFGLYIL
jgi:hypothetical protein